MPNDKDKGTLHVQLLGTKKPIRFLYASSKLKQPLSGQNIADIKHYTFNQPINRSQSK